MPKYIITLECADITDLDWLKNRALGAVEEVVADAREESRLDGDVSVYGDTDFDA